MTASRHPATVPIACLLLLAASCGAARQEGQGDLPSPESLAGEGWRKAAREMVDRQLRPRGISDNRVLQVLAATPRHLFVPQKVVAGAYLDSPLSIGLGQTISQPYIVALMTELLHLSGTEKVLEIGTGSGYQAAVLAQLTDTVYTIEIVEALADSSRDRLARLGYHNVTVRHGDGYLGWPEQAPFDCIIVTAAPPEVPPALVEQLRPGGRMVIPVGEYYQELLVITKSTSGQIKRSGVIPVRFVPMVHPKEQ
jgi:protein-L-isoaspartate(D-aspartate) O-methyltransferase